MGLKGKPVKLRYGPAAVIGNETRIWPLICYDKLSQIFGMASEQVGKARGLD